jgi:hypothetical protein
MKGISFLYILIFFNLSKKSFQQQILIPLDPGFDDNSNDNINDNDNDQDGNQSIVETKEYQSSDGTPIKITRIHYHKTKNLNGDSEAITPFQMLKIFDDRVNSIFEEFVKESMGFSNLFHRINMDYDNDDDFSNTGRKKRIKKVDDIDELFNEIDKIEKKFSVNDEDEDDDEKDDDFEFKIINTKNENSTKKIDDEKEYDPKLNDVNQDQRQKKIKERKNKKKNGKNGGNKKNEKTNENNEVKKSNEPNNSNIKKDEKSNENIKNKKVKGNKLTRKQLIFSRICKYIFYTMILFAFYFIIKKILEFLEIIDPEGASEYKILDEEAVHLKKEDNKQY